MLIMGLVALVAIVAGVLFFLSDLSGSPDTLANVSAQAVTTAAAPAQFVELSRGTQSMETRRVNYLISSTADLAKLWKLIDAGGQSPAVDFATRSVIAVFAGTKPTTGYDISVTGVEDGDTRVVTITLSSPDSTCLLGESLTPPYQIIELPKTALSLEHKNVSTTTNCL